MPTYEYLCEKCGHAFDFFQSMSSAPLAQCPKELCPQKKWGKGKVKKQMGAGAGLIFKGSGFYITDYRSKNYTEGAKKDSAGSSSSSSSTSSLSSSSSSTSGTGGGAASGSGSGSSGGGSSATPAPKATKPTKSSGGKA